MSMHMHPNYDLVLRRLLQQSMDAQWALMHSDESDEDPVKLRQNFEQALADVNAYISEHCVFTL